MAVFSGLSNVQSLDVAITDDLVITDALTVNGNSIIGDAVTDTIGFYGVTPVNQPAAASQAVYTVTATTALAAVTLSECDTNATFGFANSTVANLYVVRSAQLQVDVEGLGVLLNEIRGQLVSTGVIKGAA